MPETLLTLQHGVNHFEGLVNFFANLGASQDNLAAHKNEEDNLGLDHAVDKAREQFRFIRAEIVMARSQALKTNGEFDVARANDVLDLEVRELRIEAKLLNDASIFSGCQLGIILGLGTSDHHFTTGKDQSCGLWLANAHDNRSKTLPVS